ncbi:LysE/ArgO family amino acid transporter [Orrella marina]|uniref:Lysine transporter LysE n=1 Tax=Orrella marina TaxID=2163011 RepID=A0A2R4XPV6_9BURK|nr:LysE family transporter [Orrella marina]AWB35832.1 lysine transporter LysE [Orrella marina]
MSAFSAGMFLSISLIMAIGPQNAHLIRMGLRRQHLWLTVGVCAIGDIVLISLGVIGLSKLGGLSPTVHRLLLLAGVVFLLIYGSKAARNFLHGLKASRDSLKDEFPKVASTPGEMTSTMAYPGATNMTRKQAVLTALAFSWLNPHAWLDTAVLIGTASLAYQTPGNTVFGLGAMTGAIIWFLFLGGIACWLGQRLELKRIAHWIDGLVAIIMLAIAVLLMVNVFTI